MEVTYTFSRALHMMRYGGAKMRFVGWNSGVYIHIVKDRLQYECGSDGTLTQRELMGSWVEVK